MSTDTEGMGCDPEQTKEMDMLFGNQPGPGASNQYDDDYASDYCDEQSAYTSCPEVLSGYDGEQADDLVRQGRVGQSAPARQARRDGRIGRSIVALSRDLIGIVAVGLDVVHPASEIVLRLTVQNRDFVATLHQFIDQRPADEEGSPDYQYLHMLLRQ